MEGSTAVKLDGLTNGNTSERSFALLQVPQAASVWCMPIDLLSQEIDGFNSAPYHAWDWQSSYKEFDLRTSR